MESEKGQPMKLHRQYVDLDGRAYTVLTLRPSTNCRFETNHFHETWHVLTDPAGRSKTARSAVLVACVSAQTWHDRGDRSRVTRSEPVRCRQVLSDRDRQR
jgi:hypothetical protein